MMQNQISKSAARSLYFFNKNSISEFWHLKEIWSDIHYHTLTRQQSRQKKT